MRPLNDAEKEIARNVFGAGFPVDRVSLDTHSRFVKKHKATAYVTFHIIHYYEKLPDNLLVHEMTHVWQYLTRGSVYISESIWAQKWGGGYNYGGFEKLKNSASGHGLMSFNCEQQADIIEEYYRSKSGVHLQWSQASPEIGQILEHYREQVVWDN